MNSFVIVLTIFLYCLCYGVSSQAYPDFIGFGYKSCMTCHYNGAGGGALNDYGRALFAAEISSRAFFPASVTDERLGETAGFIPGKELGRFRPGLKVRNLYLKRQGADARSILMQADASLAIHLDKDQENVLMLTYGYVPVPVGKQGKPGEDEVPKWISREHYLRWKLSESWWIFGGMMDKVFGLRQIDHTLFSRQGLGLAQNDQTHGIVLQQIKENSELYVHLFAGNQFQEAPLRQQGLSLMYEFDTSDDARFGVSALYSKNQFVNWTRLALHSKYGLGKGAALSAEAGLKEDKPTELEKSHEMYTYVQSVLPMARGYFFFSNLQFVFRNAISNFPDDTQLSFGALMFPAPRTEFRLTAIQNRPWQAEGVEEDRWQYQAQFHLAW